MKADFPALGEPCKVKHIPAFAINEVMAGKQSRDSIILEKKVNLKQSLGRVSGNLLPQHPGGKD